MLESATAIASLRVRAPVHDGVALQQAIDRQLQGVELAPSRLPPSALLIVRQLVDPLPGRLGADPRSFRPPRKWTEAVQERLDLLLVSAGRPGGGDPPASAEAVLFADQAELVACLVLDLVRGTARQHWWWGRIGVVLPELVLPADGDVAGLAPSVLLRNVARELPAVFAYLGQWRAAVTVAATLEQQGTRELLELMAASHGVDPRIIGGPESYQESPDADPIGAGADAIMPRVQSHEERQTAARPVLPAEPWLPWLPGTVGEASLTPDQRCLVGLALGLHRAPTTVRQREFTHRARAWWDYQARIGRSAWWRDDARGEPYPGVSGTAPVGDWRPLEPISIGPASIADDDPAGSRWRGPDDAGNDGRPQHGARSRSERPTEGAASRVPPYEDSPDRGKEAPVETSPRRAREDYPASSTRDPDPPGRTDGCDTGDSPSTTAHPQAYPPAQPGESFMPVFSGEQVATGLGGVLYLLHALEDLEIPAAFEENWHLATHPGPWGVLDLIARTLLGERFGEDAGDPLWRVLAALAAQGGEPGGGSGAWASAAVGEDHPTRRHGDGERWAGWWSGSPAYRAPAGWWNGLAGDEHRVRWASAAGRLWLWSESGFLLVSVARDERHPLVQAGVELTAWAGESGFELSPGGIDQVPLAAPPEAQVADDLIRWATAATPAVARRLLLSLGIEHQDHEAVYRLLSVSGTLYLSACHVDLVADLDQIWLPARRAGLDRNPGWLADHGRVVLFHFR